MICQTGKLETAVYRKPTHTDKYLSYNSHHPVSHKKSVAKTLLQRAEHLPSNSDSQANEREYVLNILRENNYPKDFLKNCLNPSACRNQNNSEGDTSIKGYAVVSYIQGVTEPIKRILSNCNTRNTCMQQPLALVSKQPYFPNMKYLKIVVIFTLSIFLQKNVKIMKKL